MPVEENPFLGHRGIRLSLDRRDLLLEQLSAICQVARRVPTSVMFPMVTTVAEIRDARSMLGKQPALLVCPKDYASA
jgi:phosphocarrier protein FPr